MNRTEDLREWPLYFRENLSLGDPKSNVGICTLWTKREKVRSKIGDDRYRVLGNLYSSDGINYLLRNVLANPAIRYILLCGMDVTGSGDALISLFREGLAGDRRIKGTEALIDENLDASAVELVREGVRLIDLRGPINGDKLGAAIEKLDGRLPPFHPMPLYFPEPEPHVEVFPDNDNVRVIRGRYVADAWVKIVDAVMTFGRVERTEYSINQKEILNLAAVITDEDPERIVFKKWFPFSLEHLQGEAGDAPEEEVWLQYQLPLRDPQRGNEPGGKHGYYEQMAFTKELPDLSYTYGQRLWSYRGENQVFAMVDRLKEAMHSRRAMAVLWDPVEDARSQSPPCLNLLQATARGEKLHMTAYFRSHDVYRAWPENAFALRKLQKFLAGRVGSKELGDLVIFSQSAHIYEDCWPKAEDMLRDRLREMKGAKYFKRDARGNFVIRLEGKLIHVYHYSPHGNLINSFRGRSADKLLEEMGPYISLIDHALYLGKELARAEAALRLDLPYGQDGDFPA
jgi:thymidylate synthase